MPKVATQSKLDGMTPGYTGRNSLILHPRDLPALHFRSVIVVLGAQEEEENCIPLPLWRLYIFQFSGLSHLLWVRSGVFGQPPGSQTLTSVATSTGGTCGQVSTQFLAVKHPFQFLSLGCKFIESRSYVFIFVPHQCQLTSNTLRKCRIVLRNPV